MRSISYLKFRLRSLDKGIRLNHEISPIESNAAKHKPYSSPTVYALAKRGQIFSKPITA